MLRIKGWKETYETAASRRLVKLDWVPVKVPNRSHGLIVLKTYGKDGNAARGLYFDLIAITAQLRPEHRGNLCRSDGRPLSLRAISGHVDMRVEDVEELLGLLMSDDVGWIEEVQDPQPKETGKGKDAALDMEAEIVDYNPNAGLPQTLPIDTSKPIPFGIEADAIETTDWIRIEKSFLALWNTKEGLLPAGDALSSMNQRTFQKLCHVPGWLSTAEKAINKFPTPWHIANAPQKLSIKNFLDDDQAAAAIADGGKYSKASTKESASKPVEKSADVIAASQRANRQATQDREAKTAREKAYRERLAEKWGAEAGLVTVEEVKDLDAKFPAKMLLPLYHDAQKKTCPDSKRRLYVAMLHECLEMASGGKSFAETEEER